MDIINSFKVRPPTRFDLGGGDIIVETSGYISKSQQLSNLMASGEALNAYYKKLYPNFERTPKDNLYDPTTQVGYDFFDAMHDVQIVASNLQAAEASAVASGSLDNIGQVTPNQVVTPPNEPQPMENQNVPS